MGGGGEVGEKGGLTPMTFTEKCSSPFPQFEERPLASSILIKSEHGYKIISPNSKIFNNNKKLRGRKDECKVYFGD